MASPKQSPKSIASKVAKAPGVEKLLRPGLTQLAPRLEQVAYRGAVPLKGFVGWLGLVLLAAVVVGGLLSHILVQNRADQLVSETTSRVTLQAQGRTAVVAEWVKGVAALADAIAGSEMVRLYATEAPQAAAPAEGAPLTEASAILAQKPYIQQWLKEFVTKNRFSGAALVGLNGAELVSAGEKPSLLSQPDLLKSLVRQGLPEVRPLAQSNGQVVMDMLRPVRALALNDAAGAPVGALLVRLPVGNKIAELLAATPLDQAGERTVLLQTSGTGAEVVGATNLAPVQGGAEALGSAANVGLHTSVVDGKGVFSILKPVPGTPLALLQEYVASQALALMGVYKPGIYVIVTLSLVVLAALMMALTLHLMGQRNRTRVKMLGQTMDALVRVVEGRDAFLSGHHTKVARLAVAVANLMHMDVAERATLFYAAQMAAVGRLMVPRDMLAKKGALTSAERKELESHINQSIVVLGDLDFDLPIVPVITQMYERADGSGHPHGLKGSDISQMAKVLGACDAYVALTSPRAHRAALSRDEALKAMAGGAFDAEVVSTLKTVAR